VYAVRISQFSNFTKKWHNSLKVISHRNMVTCFDVIRGCAWIPLYNVSKGDGYRALEMWGFLHSDNSQCEIWGMGQRLYTLGMRFMWHDIKHKIQQRPTIGGNTLQDLQWLRGITGNAERYIAWYWCNGYKYGKVELINASSFTWFVLHTQRRARAKMAWYSVSTARYGLGL
jgi:hypothetical protein